MTRTAVLRCTLVAVLFAATGLSGCGRRGDLEPAPESGISAAQARQQAKAAQAVQNAPVDGTTSQPRLLRNVKPPKDPFVLDPLL